MAVKLPVAEAVILAVLPPVALPTAVVGWRIMALGIAAKAALKLIITTQFPGTPVPAVIVNEPALSYRISLPNILNQYYSRLGSAGGQLSIAGA